MTAAVRPYRLSLDTCACKVNLEVDNSLPPDQIVFTVTGFQNRCPAHDAGAFPAGEGGITNQQLFDNVIREENGRKNIGRDIILQNAPSALFDLDNNGNRVFKKGISVSWSWTGAAPNRVLTLTLAGITLTTNQLNSVQTKLAERFGLNNVVIVNG